MNSTEVHTPLGEFIKSYTNDPILKAQTVDKARSILETKGILNTTFQNPFVYQMIEGVPHAVLSFLDDQGISHKVTVSQNQSHYVGSTPDIHHLVQINPVEITKDRETPIKIPSVTERTENGEISTHPRSSARRPSAKVPSVNTIFRSLVANTPHIGDQYTQPGLHLVPDDNGKEIPFWEFTKLLEALRRRMGF